MGSNSHPGRGAVESGGGPRTTALLYRPAEAHVEEVGEAMRGAETVLQVEDDDLVRGLTRTMLETFGYHVPGRERRGSVAAPLRAQGRRPIHRRGNGRG